MSPVIGFPLLVVLLVLIFWLRHLRKKRQQAALLATQLPVHQRQIIADMVPLTQKMPPTLRAQLDGKVSLFLHQVEFIGHGIDVTEEMKLSIAAQACLIIVNRDQWYKHLRTILIYPSAFRSKQQSNDGFVVTEESQTRLGESWAYGPVVLSWPHAEQGGINDRDGHNLVLHEFAHQLDQLTGDTDGVPPLSKGQSFAEWERAIMDAFERHQNRVEHGHKTVIDPYGAQNYQEFLAVTVELFFEKPSQLREDEPAVYNQLRKLLKIDPESWG